MSVMTKSKSDHAAEMEVSAQAEQLREIVKDLKRIRGIIPSESSRHGCLNHIETERAIIEYRKIELLNYIQVICDDHIHWSEKLLNRQRGAPNAR
jgi:hypothetical protein